MGYANNGRVNGSLIPQHGAKCKLEEHMPITEIYCSTCGDTGEVVVYIDEEGNDIIKRCPCSLENE